MSALSPRSSRLHDPNLHANQTAHQINTKTTNIHANDPNTPKPNNPIDITTLHVPNKNIT